MRNVILSALMLMLSAPAFSQEATTVTLSWNADEAFAEKGLIVPYGSVDGMVWQPGSGVSISFSRAAADYVPQNLFVPEPNVWLCHGAELRISSEDLPIVGVRVVSLPDYPFSADLARCNPGDCAPQCSGREARWTLESQQNLIITQQGDFASVQEPGARVAVCEIEITCLLPADSAIDAPCDKPADTPVCDLLGRPVSASYRGITVRNRRLSLP